MIETPPIATVTDAAAVPRDGTRARRSGDTYLDPPVAGESWAYRARAGDPLAEVVVVKVGVKKPARVQIRWVDDRFEGRQEWVPPGRLKIPWVSVVAFLARERQWDALLSASVTDDSPESDAASIVFDELIDPSLALLGYEWACTTVTILDVVGLAAFLGLDPDDLRRDPLSFLEHGGLVAPWSVAQLVAVRATERHPEAILRHVHKDETKARQEAIYGDDYGSRGSPHHISSDICRQLDDEHGKPVRAVLRDWCGAEVVGRWDEASDLRDEIVRLGKVIDNALAALLRAGANRDAKVIERDRRHPADT